MVRWEHTGSLGKSNHREHSPGTRKNGRRHETAKQSSEISFESLTTDYLVCAVLNERQHSTK